MRDKGWGQNNIDRGIYNRHQVNLKTANLSNPESRPYRAQTQNMNIIYASFVQPSRYLLQLVFVACWLQKISRYMSHLRLFVPGVTECCHNHDETPAPPPAISPAQL